MALNGDARAQAVYTAIATADPNFGQLNSAEQNTLLSHLKSIYGADTTYLTANAVILPGSMQAPAGATVSTTGSAVAQTGATTSPVTIAGTGNLT